jgi:histidyl-tRNA synthetase
MKNWKLYLGILLLGMCSGLLVSLVLVTAYKDSQMNEDKVTKYQRLRPTTDPSQREFEETWKNVVSQISPEDIVEFTKNSNDMLKALQDQRVVLSVNNLLVLKLLKEGSIADAKDILKSQINEHQKELTSKKDLSEGQKNLLETIEAQKDLLED